MNMMTRFSSTRVQAFGSGGAFLRSKEPIDNDTLARVAPSIFAPERHSSRSERYTYIPTVTVLDGLRREGFAPFFVKQGGSRDTEKRGFTKHMIRLRRHDAAMTVGGDSVPEIVLLNSHDGTSAYQLMFGWFRLVCSNGMIVADSSKGSVGIKVPHKGDIVGQVIEASYSVLGEGEAQAERLEHMRAVSLTTPEQEAFARAALTLRYDEESAPPVAPAEINRAVRTADIGNDLWRTFNRTQEHLINGGLSYVQRDQNGRAMARRHTRPVNSVDGDVKLNRALWVLAEEMAKLKAA